MKKRLLIGASLAALLVGVGLAMAQTINPPQISTINNAKDLIPVVPSGAGTAQSKYATSALITNAPGYVKVTPSQSGVSYTGYVNYFGNSQSYLILIESSTLGYNYVYAATAPSDGARECVFASGAGALGQLNFVAASGQTVTGGGNLAVAANAGVCFTYSLSNLTWDRS